MRNPVAFPRRPSLRDVVRDLLPYGVVRAIRRRNKGIVGDYPDWETALRATGLYKPDMTALIDTVRRYRGGEGSFLNQYDPTARGVSYPLLAGLLTASVRSGGTLGVLDFGGSLGQTWFGLEWTLRHLPSTVWCVVDQPECVAGARSVFQSDRLRFYTSADEAAAEHDLDTIVCSSTLQYLDEPYNVLRMLAGLGLPNLILDRTVISSTDTELFMRQHTPADMGGDVHPLRALSRAKLDAVLAGRYRLHDEHGYGDFPMEGDAATYRYLMYTLDLETRSHSTKCS